MLRGETRRAAGERNTRPSFNGHPPLGVNATKEVNRDLQNPNRRRFNGHPPLGVNATLLVLLRFPYLFKVWVFQWAPTLGGECYKFDEWFEAQIRAVFYVSMGTHPWG